MSADDEKTPPRGPSDSERQAFATRWPVREMEPHDTSPIDLLDRPVAHDDERDLVLRLQGNPRKLAEYVGKLSTRVMKIRRDDSSENRRAVDELRELLNKPPNGAMARLQSDVSGLSRAIEEIGERLHTIETDTATETEVADLRREHGFAKWIGRTVLAIVGALIVYVGSGILARVERDGETTIRLKHLEESIDHLQRQIDRSYYQSLLPKDTQP
jgi:hypothetical protein